MPKYRSNFIPTHFVTFKIHNIRGLGRRSHDSDEVYYGSCADRFLRDLTVDLKGKTNWQRHRKPLDAWHIVEFTQTQSDPHIHMQIHKPEWVDDCRFTNAVHRAARRQASIRTGPDDVDVRAIQPGTSGNVDRYMIKECQSQQKLCGR